LDTHRSPAAQLDDRVGTVRLLRSAAPPHNLPATPTSFVGRERELAEVERLLIDHRLVTLTGPGGCGKTRLALRVASDVLERFPDGTWWVGVASQRDPELVGAAIAETLGVRPLPGLTPLQAAGAYLASRRSLVILDNCEHLTEACAEAGDALANAGAGVFVLATSRAPLGAGEETEWRVPSLTLPTDEVDRFEASDAVALFVERARQARSSFELSKGNAEPVAEICTALDGLPLAIELAAARLRMLSVKQIATGVSDRFRLLTRGPRTESPRLQTLRASVDWSYDLLSDAERALLRRLGVFSGTFSLDAAERVCSADGIETDQVLDLLAELVDQSLVLAEEGGLEMRYRLLETLRQYGLERLAEAGEEERLRDRHRDFFLALAERAAPHLETERQREWFEVLDPEAANLAAAIDHAIRSDPPLALRLCTALFMWWRGRQTFAQAQAAYSRALAAAEDGPAAPRARALWGRGNNALGLGEFEAAGADATEALALAEDAGDPGTASRARCLLGLSAAYVNPAAGRSDLRRAVELARTAGDQWALVEAAQFAAIGYLFQDDHTRLRGVLDEVDAVTDRIAEGDQVARRALILASIAILDGRLTEAREVLKGALAAEHADPAVQMWLQAQVGLLDICRGEPARALEHLQARLGQAIETGVGMAIPALLTWTTWAELATGRLVEARQRAEATIQIVEGRDCLLDAWSRWLLGEILRLSGDDRADAAAESTCATGEKMGNRLAATRGRMTQARLAAGRGEWSTAEQHALAHLDACVEGGHATFIPYCFDALAEVAAGGQGHADSVRLFAAALRARTDLGVGRWTPEEDHWQSIVCDLRDALGGAAYETAWAAGSLLSIEEAVAWARRARGPRKRPPGGWGSLTPTEAKVVELICEGLTNRQIGERMFVSPQTVKTHLSHIFRKLDVNSRAELAAQSARRSTPR
jgi:predicted ATPase/DNA-binding CsgD family transcriptional regulator